MHLLEQCNNLNLFDAQSAFFIHFQKNPNKELITLLEPLVNRQKSADLYLLITAKINQKDQQSKWFKFLSTHALNITLWPLNEQQTLRYLKLIGQKYQLKFQLDALQMIAHSYEGNLLAANQLIEKLSNQTTSKTFTLEAIYPWIAPSNQHDAFELIDAFLMQNYTKFQRTLSYLSKQPSPKNKQNAILLVALLYKEVRLLLSLKTMASEHIQTLFKSQKIWPSKQTLYLKLASQLSITYLVHCLSKLHKTDVSNKNFNTATTQNPWHQLQGLIQR